uniref:Uncharacterized protein n=1 Tax=viral metagenome TaxID=1070528 RepID=A0A6M3JZA6_9ZZZZ
MKCILLSMVSYHLNGYLPNGGAECRKEECAWWDKARNRCAVLTIGEQLVGIDWSLHNVECKLPEHERLI